MAKTASELWIDECKQLSIEYQDKYKLNPSIPMALIMYATGMGEYPIENNPFGIMGVSSLGFIEKKAYDTALYWEYSSSIDLRKYNSIRECFEDFIAIIQELFPEAWSVRPNAKIFRHFLRTDTLAWSLDPNFDAKYKRLIKLY